jgi:hypothetical protein
MNPVADDVQDVMQVCRNGHVITDQLRSCPESAQSRCDRCGAATLDRCLTCGRELPGAIAVPGLRPVGVRQPPHYCPTCGAAFPWTLRQRPPKKESLLVLEGVLRRLPRVIRQLRVRHGDRPPFRVLDEIDLEDLLRALLPLHFDEVRPEVRTPRYASATRTDFLLPAEGIALAIKFPRPDMDVPTLLEQTREDAVYYQREKKCRTLVIFVYDPEGALRERCLPEAIAAEFAPELELRLVVSAP